MKKDGRRLLHAVLCSVSTVLILSGVLWFRSSHLLIVTLTPKTNGMGNQMFRYAAGLGLAERNPEFQVCWSGWNWFSQTEHPNSFFLDHVAPTGRALPECPLATQILGEILLPRFTPPFSKYVPLDPKAATIVTGAMESFRYFPAANTPPIFQLKTFSTASLWMRERNLTSAIHVRRGDYTFLAAPIGFYKRARVRHDRTVVVTDDPKWVRAHPSVFHGCVLSEGHGPGFDMALLASATDTVVIGIGTFAWWGAYLSRASRVIYYGRQAGYKSPDYVEEDRMPKHWIRLS